MGGRRWNAAGLAGASVPCRQDNLRGGAWVIRSTATKADPSQPQAPRSACARLLDRGSSPERAPACPCLPLPQDMTARLWDLRYPAASFALLKAHIGAVRSLRFRYWGPRGLLLPTPPARPCSASCLLRCKMAAISCTCSSSCLHPCARVTLHGPPGCGPCSPDGRFLAVAEPADYVTIYDAAEG